MSQINNSKIPLAVENHTKLDLSCDHATTSMFMLLQPVFYRQTMKTENLHLKFTSVVRPNPILLPTFGRLRQNIRHFFVPYRLIFPNWYEFSEQTIASNYSNSSQVAGVPYTNPSEILTMFFGSGTDLADNTGTPNRYDFFFSGSYWLLTRKGRNFYKILYSLGYDILPGDKHNFKWNLLNLLAYARVYIDWYANSQYLNSAPILRIEQYFKYNDPSNALFLSSTDLYRILSFVLPAVYNTNGYFEAAWDTTTPGVPVTGQYNLMSFSDPTSTNDNVVKLNPLGNAEMFQNNPSSSVGTQYLHTALQKLQNYQRRHALAGARSIDRLLASYGLQPEYLRLSRSIYVGVMSNDIDIKSIFATANGSDGNSTSVVGDYAGAGLGSGSHEVQFQNDEEGVFISIQTIQPSGGYYQGYDRNNRHISRSEFFIPDFDTLGVQAIEKGEVYVSRNLDTFAQDATAYTTPFGFTGRYGEMKRSINRVSGDFAFDSQLVGGSAWHLMRRFTDSYFNDSVNNIVHTEDFCRGTDAESYMRMFTFTDYEVDPFNVFIHVDAASYAPCASLTDGYDWNLDTQKITMDSNGPKLN